MTRTQTVLRRTGAISILAALTLLYLPLGPSPTNIAQAQVVENTCADVGFQNLESSVSGEWGSITFAVNQPTLTLMVNEGYEVTLCVKAGSAQQGDGPEVSGPYSEGTYQVAHSTDKELSHFGFTFDVTTTTTTPEETTTTTTQPETTTTTQPETTTTTEATTTTQGDEEPTTTTTEATTTTSSPEDTTTTSTLPEESTTTTQPQIPTTPPLTLGEIEAVCVSNIPFLSYSVDFPGVTNLSSITFVNPEPGGENVVYVNPPLTGQVLWPGAAPEPNPDWPGWILGDDGIWREGDDGFLWARETVTVIFEINPTATLTVDYPPASAICAGPVNPDTPGVAATSTTTTRPPLFGTLPFTGAGYLSMKTGIATGLLVAGLLTLLLASGFGTRRSDNT